MNKNRVDKNSGCLQHFSGFLRHYSGYFAAPLFPTYFILCLQPPPPSTFSFLAPWPFGFSRTHSLTYPAHDSNHSHTEITPEIQNKMLQASLTALATLMVSASFAPRVHAQTFPEGVLATGTMGPTNPPQPTLGTAINQTSMSRLLTVNSIDVCLSSPNCVLLSPA